MTNKEYANALREIADFYEANPGFPQPTHPLKIFGIYSTRTKEEFQNVAKQLKIFRKDFDDKFIRITRDFSGIKLSVIEYKEKICTKRVVGTRLVKKEKPMPIKFEKEMVAEEIVEWDCHSSLLNQGEQNE